MRCGIVGTRRNDSVVQPRGELRARGVDRRGDRRVDRATHRPRPAL